MQSETCSTVVVTMAAAIPAATPIRAMIAVAMMVAGRPTVSRSLWMIVGGDLNSFETDPTEKDASASFFYCWHVWFGARYEWRIALSRVYHFLSITLTKNASKPTQSLSAMLLMRKKVG